MSEKTRVIRVEFGPFRIVLEGYDSSSEGVDMAVQLIRNLSAKDLSSAGAAFAPSAADAPRDQSEQDRQKSHKPLLLQESARDSAAPEQAAEFHTIRLDIAQSAEAGQEPQWLADIERLEASARQAVDRLTNGHDRPATPAETGAAPETGIQPAEPSPAAAPQAPATPPEDPRPQNPVHPSPASEAVDPGPDSDDFAPRLVANADIQPEDGDPLAQSDRSIREGMDINRRAIEQAAADGTTVNGPLNAAGHDYLAMEDKAIDRLLETTNALLENDDHTRKNQSLDRLKAAVVATEAERRISVKTATGTVTLDFEEQGSTRRPVADLLAAPKIDPEKRRQRLQDYRKMIAEHKKRP